MGTDQVTPAATVLAGAPPERRGEQVWEIGTLLYSTVIEL
jgi:hypothetical protein